MRDLNDPEFRPGSDGKPNDVSWNDGEFYYQAGDDHYKITRTFDSAGRPRLTRIKLQRQTIVRQKGEAFVSKIPYYDAQVVVPSHTHYKRDIGTCINLYHKLEIKPRKGSIKAWEKLIKHIAGDQAELLWDYIQLLYLYPLQVLPVLCLVSPENGTGKSTFANGLSYLLEANVGFYTQDDLNSQFNTWLLSLVAVFEEISDTVRSLNKIKAMSTAKQATVNAKYQQPIQVEPFVKIIILSNNDETFIRATENDIRYWVIKVAPLPEDDLDPDFDEKLRAEAPAVLDFLLRRKLSTTKQSRMWFAPELIRTQALAKVVEESRSDIRKDLEAIIEEKLDDVGAFYATPSDILRLLANKYRLNEVSGELKRMGYQKMPQMRFTDVFGDQNRNGQPYYFSRQTIEPLPAVTETVPEDDFLPF